MALYAFCREVDDIVDECDDANVARIKLEWWRNEVGQLYQGHPQHPVTQSLATAIQRFNLPQEYFLEIIDGMEMDLDQFSYPSFRELNLYCYRVAAVVGLLAAEIFGYEDRQTLKYAHDLGIAFQLINIIRDVAEDSHRGRIYIPLDEMERFGVSIDDILQRRMSDKVRDLMAFQAQRARQYYEKALAELPDADRYRQRSGLIMAEIYLETLQEIENDGFRVVDRRTSLTPVRKLWLAWKTSRREKKRYRKLAWRK